MASQGFPPPRRRTAGHGRHNIVTSDNGSDMICSIYRSLWETTPVTRQGKIVGWARRRWQKGKEDDGLAGLALFNAYTTQNVRWHGQWMMVNCTPVPSSREGRRSESHMNTISTRPSHQCPTTSWPSGRRPFPKKEMVSHAPQNSNMPLAKRPLASSCTTRVVAPCPPITSGHLPMSYPACCLTLQPPHRPRVKILASMSPATASHCLTHLEYFSHSLHLRWLWYDWTAEGKPWQGSILPCDETDKQLFRVSMIITLGNGGKAKFWHDRWLDGQFPKEITLSLYKLVTRKNKTVAQELKNHRWLRPLRRMSSTTEVREFILLWHLIQQVQIDEEREDDLT